MGGQEEHFKLRTLNRVGGGKASPPGGKVVGNGNNGCGGKETSHCTKSVGRSRRAEEGEKRERKRKKEGGTQLNIIRTPVKLQ